MGVAVPLVKQCEAANQSLHGCNARLDSWLLADDLWRGAASLAAAAVGHQCGSDPGHRPAEWRLLCGCLSGVLDRGRLPRCSPYYAPAGCQGWEPLTLCCAKLYSAGRQVWQVQQFCTPCYALEVGLAHPAGTSGGLSIQSLGHMLNCLFWALAGLSGKHTSLGARI